MRAQLKQAIRAALVTVAVLSMIYFLWYAVGGYAYYMAGVDKENLNETRNVMRLIQKSIEQYRMQIGQDSYPATWQDLHVFAASVPTTDPWGNSYQYQTNGSEYTVSTVYYKHRFGSTEIVWVATGDTDITTEEHRR